MPFFQFLDNINALYFVFLSITFAIQFQKDTLIQKQTTEIYKMISGCAIPCPISLENSECI